MELNEMLRSWGKEPVIAPREEKILETVRKAQAISLEQEQERFLSYWEFLWNQLRFTRKRWWALQGALLILAWRILPGLQGHFYRVRSLGVVGCLFVVLLIPELWRNREANAVQVEAACLYSLRQVYAARITLFGMVDVALVTVFGLSLGKMGLSFPEVVAQFLLPLTVTACICFSLLCGKANYSETASLTACLIWCGSWWLILMNENIYTTIVPAVWLSLFGIALGFLALAVRAAVRTANQHWEVDFA